MPCAKSSINPGKSHAGPEITCVFCTILRLFYQVKSKGGKEKTFTDLLTFRLHLDKTAAAAILFAQPRLFNFPGRIARHLIKKNPAGTLVAR